MQNPWQNVVCGAVCLRATRKYIQPGFPKLRRVDFTPHVQCCRTAFFEGSYLLLLLPLSNSQCLLDSKVTQMTYCKATKIIISADYHGSVVITSEIQCKLKEVRPPLPC